MQCVFNASNILEAHIVAGLLEQHNIPSHVTGFFLQGGVGELPATDIAQVCVADDFKEAASSIFAQYEAGDFAEQASP
jgi:hypothetical protein